MTLEFIHSLLTSLAAWVWHSSIAAAVLVACVVVTQIVVQKFLAPRAVLVLWWLIAIRLIMPISPGSPISVFNFIRAEHHPMITPAPLATLIESPLPIEKTVPTLAAAQNKPRLDQVLQFASYFWCLGVLAFLAIILNQHRRMARWAGAQPPLIQEPLQTLLRECSNTLGIRRQVTAVATTTLDTPAIFGMIRPRLLMPKALLTTLSADQLRLVLLHELIHVKRHHVLQNWFLIIIQSLHWFNPLVWFAFRQLRKQREIVCDRSVLAHLEGRSQNIYADTLINIARGDSRLRSVPTLVPILGHKKHIHRRIRMISNYKKLSRIAAVCSGLIVAILACVLLTGAEKRAAAPVSTNGAFKLVANVDALERELDHFDKLVQVKEKEVDSLKERLEISDLDEAAFGKPDPDALRRLEALKIDAMERFERANTLFASLTNRLTNRQLRDALSTAAPDQFLTELQSRQAALQEKYAEDSETYGSDHPESKKTQRMMNQVEQQISERVDGVMHGLEFRVRNEKAVVDRIEGELRKAKDRSIARALQQRPYFQAKRDLENLRNVRDQLWRRTIENKVDGMLKPGAAQ